jgi:hypothetical protein
MAANGKDFNMGWRMTAWNFPDFISKVVLKFLAVSAAPFTILQVYNCNSKQTNLFAARFCSKDKQTQLLGFPLKRALLFGRKKYYIERKRGQFDASLTFPCHTKPQLTVLVEPQ